MKRTFNGVWYVQKQITRKGTTCSQWFKCKAPAQSVGYLGELVACDAHQEAAIADIRRSRKAQHVAALVKPSAAEGATRDMLALVAWADGGLGAELERLENEGGPTYEQEERAAIQNETVVYVITPEQILAAATPETRKVVYPGEETQTGELTAAQQKWRDETTAKVISLAEHRQRVYEDAMNH